MKKLPSDIDPRFRSLLQKAVRRGHVDLVFIAGGLVESVGARGRDWFRSRTAVITFEECWPLGTNLALNRKFYSKLAALVRAAREVKAKDAAGLGCLARRLADNDRTVLEGNAGDRAIKIVASGMLRPNDFWRWIRSQARSDPAGTVIEYAHLHRSAGSAADRAILQAAAYLAAAGEMPPVRPAAPVQALFPYWIALDHHTPQGRRALGDIARDLHIPTPQLEWACFYFEGSATNEILPSPWWDRYCDWQFRKIGLPADEAHLLWEPAKPQLVERLSEESRQLHRQLYEWKLNNRETIDTLKKQVDFFIAHPETAQRDQLEIF